MPRIEGLLADGGFRVFFWSLSLSPISVPPSLSFFLSVCLSVCRSVCLSLLLAGWLSCWLTGCCLSHSVFPSHCLLGFRFSPSACICIYLCASLCLTLCISPSLSSVSPLPLSPLSALHLSYSLPSVSLCLSLCLLSLSPSLSSSPLSILVLITFTLTFREQVTIS